MSQGSRVFRDLLTMGCLESWGPLGIWCLEFYSNSLLELGLKSIMLASSRPCPKVGNVAREKVLLLDEKLLWCIFWE